MYVGMCYKRHNIQKCQEKLVLKSRYFASFLKISLVNFNKKKKNCNIFN